MLLAFGVVAERNLRAWLVETGAEIDHDGPEGAAVVLGHRDSDPARIAIARADLAGLLEAGGIGIAGAGIDLGEGFVSARLAGATGDRRDAVLAAMRVLGVTGAWRLGERGATLVALFGVTATKPVGAAAEEAIAEQRWAALELASAAADILGPEQLVRVLNLRPADGIDPIPAGAPSVLAANLRRTLESFSRPRRLELLLDLWERVCAHQEGLLARERLIASHDLTVLKPLDKRYRHFDQETVVDLVHHDSRRELDLLTAIRFRPTWRDLWKHCVERLIEDALAATVLLRLAVAVHESGVSAGVERVRDELALVAGMFTGSQIKKAQRPVPKLIALPARPIVHVRELNARLRQQQPLDAAFERLLRPRLRTALAYGLTVHEAAKELLVHGIPRDDYPDSWDSDALRTWRSAVGYTGACAPGAWDVEPLVRQRWQQSLAQRLAAHPAAIEQASDLMWMGDLADAIARARGHAAAELNYEYIVPYHLTNPALPQPEPLTPRVDSIPLAVAGTTQLLALGATAPARPRDWSRLCAELMASGAVARALTGEFEIPESVLVHDGTALPGTATRIQFARTATRLAEWSDYMGNCIAGPAYQDAATRGRSILLALRDENDIIQINAELRARADGWFVNEIAARFNHDPDPALRQAVQRWASTLRAPEADLDSVDVDLVGVPARGRRPASNLMREAAPALRAATHTALTDAQSALRVLAVLTGEDLDPTSAADPKVLTALRRSTADELHALCVKALDSGRVTLPRLWQATAVRPLASALSNLDPALRTRHPRLRTLTIDAPIPSKTLRTLVKEPDLATARGTDLVAVRVRRALAHLARTSDPIFVQAVSTHPTPAVLCPLILTITSTPDIHTATIAVATPGADAVPGFPATSLSDPDGPWQQSWPSAIEVGADQDSFAAQLAQTGLRVPAAWLPSGGWPALWSRAHTTAT